MLQRVAEPEHRTPLPELSSCGGSTEGEENDGEIATHNREKNSINTKEQKLPRERPHNGHQTELLNLPYHVTPQGLVYHVTAGSCSH